MVALSVVLCFFDGVCVCRVVVVVIDVVCCFVFKCL